MALGVYPFEEPGIGPNKHNFNDEVLYEIHVALGDDLNRGRKTIGYQFKFETEFQGDILQSYRFADNGIVDAVSIDSPDPDQNLVQRYTVTKVEHQARTGRHRFRYRPRAQKTVLGSGVVPPKS